MTCPNVDPKPLFPLDVTCSQIQIPHIKLFFPLSSLAQCLPIVLPHDVEIFPSSVTISFSWDRYANLVGIDSYDDLFKAWLNVLWNDDGQSHDRKFLRQHGMLLSESCTKRGEVVEVALYGAIRKRFDFDVGHWNPSDTGENCRAGNTSEVESMLHRWLQLRKGSPCESLIIITAVVITGQSWSCGWNSRECRMLKFESSQSSVLFVLLGYRQILTAQLLHDLGRSVTQSLFTVTLVN